MLLLLLLLLLRRHCCYDVIAFVHPEVYPFSIPKGVTYRRYCDFYSCIDISYTIRWHEVLSKANASMWPRQTIDRKSASPKRQIDRYSRFAELIGVPGTQTMDVTCVYASLRCMRCGLKMKTYLLCGTYRECQRSISVLRWYLYNSLVRRWCTAISSTVD